MESTITKIEIIPVKIALNEPFVISKGPLTHATITIVKIYTPSGIYGIGECCPFRTIHGETQEGTLSAGATIARVLIGKDARQIRQINRMMDRVFAGNASIKAAIDIALHDLSAKLVNLPLYALLNGNPIKPIHTDMTVSLLEKEKMAAKAKQYVDNRFPVLKIKLGDRPAEKDIERMRGIRAAIGMEIPLCIDANQGWNYNEARFALTNMSDLNIMHCEAPMNSNNLIQIRQLRQESPIPLMADESVFSASDAFQVLATECFDLVNIKLGKSGGITNAMKIAAIAEANDVYCQVGCFSESRLGISALAHFVTAWDHIIHFDMDAPLMHQEDPIIGGISYDENWKIILNSKPGIGADYDPDFLNRFQDNAITISN